MSLPVSMKGPLVFQLSYLSGREASQPKRVGLVEGKETAVTWPGRPGACSSMKPKQRP